jgi:hypothetical protein
MDQLILQMLEYMSKGKSSAMLELLGFSTITYLSVNPKDLVAVTSSTGRKRK